MTNLRVSLEIGPHWVFASALDWPGWCRRGRGEQAAVDTLIEYGFRYARVAGASFRPGDIEVIGQVPGNAITDSVHRTGPRDPVLRQGGARVPPRTPWDEQRAVLAAALRSGAPGGTWPARYIIRRSAWHVLDHAWEIEDRIPVAG
jgi:hypothetical protein